MRGRDRRVRVGQGDKPSLANVGADGVAAAAQGSGNAGGGSRALKEINRYGRMRYSPGEESAVRKEIEKGLRLKRLEQVRQQSRQQAAALRTEYRLRRDANRRAAVLEAKVLLYYYALILI